MATNYTLRAEAYRKLGQPQRAIEDLEEAIGLKPDLGKAYQSRALAYTLLGKDAEAQQDVDKAGELGVDSASLETAIREIKEQR